MLKDEEMMNEFLISKGIDPLKPRRKQCKK